MEPSLSPLFRRLAPLCAAVAGWVITCASGRGAADGLGAGFVDPPAATRPWVYWYWISDNVSREGITRDLEAMARVGIGEALIGNIFLDDVEKGSVKVLSDEWWGMVEHAIREGGRLGVDIGMFNCPGWSQSGGPWITPGESMRYLVSGEVRAKGPSRFEGKLPAPAEDFQDVAVVAFGAPAADAEAVSALRPKATSAPAAGGIAAVVDGDHTTEFALPEGAGQGAAAFAIDIDLPEAFTARSLVLHPGQSAFAADFELLAFAGDGSLRSVRAFAVDRSNVNPGIGPMRYGPVAIAFPPERARRFRLVAKNVRGRARLAEIDLRGGARLERFVEKQLGKMHPTPLPMWDTYLWPPATGPESPDFAVVPDKVIDLTDRLQPDGTLAWDAPAGEWVILRIGMAPTGARNSPASPEGQGLEVDKMNRAAAKAHFDAFIGKILSRLSPDERKAFKHVVADSYEMGSQNWTDGLADLFRKQYGYDPVPWLPALTGRVVGDADRSDRFLWDLRRLVADRVAKDYVGGLRDACHAHGLKLWLENYGHWGFPAEFLQYGGEADHVSGEFWATGDLGSIELRAASSAAHIYGKPIVSAEAFTSVLKFESTPWSLKRRGDWALCEGINHWVLHVYIHQPWEDRLPGVNAWFSTEFNRHNTWFDQGRAWIDYYRRAHFLLQQGEHVADVAYFIGEDTPKMTGARKPELPPGHDFDYINAEVIEGRLGAEGGRLALPGGKSYRILVLPDLDTMRPAVLRKIRDLAAGGGAILGPPPSRSPSMQGYPDCDTEVRRLAEELWSGLDGKLATRTAFGKGTVFRGTDLRTALDTLGAGPDVAGIDPAQILWTHRASNSADIYFLCNQSDRAVTRVAEFRVPGKAPEFWDAVTGRITHPAAFAQTPGGIRVPVTLEPRGSLFVVFRSPVSGAPTVAEVTREGKPLLQTAPLTEPPGIAPGARDTENTFTMAGWVRPAAEIALPAEANAGAQTRLARNDAVFPVHGDTAYPSGGRACAGISVGNNGACVYEHAANYFAPLLVHPATIDDWTHVAVVYRDGRPALFLDGKLARQGLQSQKIVHSSLAAGGRGGGAFRGELAEFQHFDRALSQEELATLVAERPGSGGGFPPPITLSRTADGAVEAMVAASGTYAIRFSDGATRQLQVNDVPAPQEIRGPWDVAFPGERDRPPAISLERLMPLETHPDPRIRYFSGTASYSCQVSIDATRLADGRRLFLDLGRVESIAELSLNGKGLGTLWKPPFLADITGAAKPGTNQIQIRVTGTWSNRLIGHVKFPEGLPGAAGDATPFRPHLTADIKLRPDAPLSPFGLIGPVRLIELKTERLDR